MQESSTYQRAKIAHLTGANCCRKLPVASRNSTTSLVITTPLHHVCRDVSSLIARSLLKAVPICWAGRPTMRSYQPDNDWKRCVSFRRSRTDKSTFGDLSLLLQDLG
ncbi:hypothetical protein CDAR_503771 [Caerostris darwini]|uniref:Uncharacterized protein n=1 Tax=Caerostris darwini TaxID=1538125 RepID=A0AAV4PCL1_9ARAC|nr:hypothetical protein CDAR_503771 [Caerostris darwini]